MKVLDLKISAFGPYAELQRFDMTKLGERGIFLVTGDTGAGKTTIFDAIMFALYGEASGDVRESNMLRSKYADVLMPTYVEMSFSYGGKIYRIKRNPEYERPAKRGQGTVFEKAEAELYYPDGSVATGVKNVNEKIIEIVGLNRNQFKQVAMIAQGDFLRLILADTKERREIFRNLFNTGLYQKLQDMLKDMARERKEAYESLKNSMNQYINDIEISDGNAHSDKIRILCKEENPHYDEIISELEEYIQSDKGREDSLQRNIYTISKELENVNEELVKAHKANRGFEQLKIIEGNILKINQELIFAEEKYRETLKEKSQIDLINSRITTLENTMPVYSELKEKEEKFGNISKEYNLHKNDYVNKNALLEKNKSKLEILKEKVSKLINYDSKIELITKDITEKEERKERIENINKYFNEYILSLEELRSAKENYLKERDFAYGLKADYISAEKFFMDGQAGILASELKLGTPCPVCGSKEHPNPAKIITGIPSEEELKKLKLESEKADSKVKECSEKASILRERSKIQKEMIEEMSVSFDFLTDFDSLDKFKQEIKEKMYQINRDLSYFANDLKKLEAEKNEIKSVENEIEILEKNISETAELLITVKEKGVAASTSMKHLEENIMKIKGSLEFTDIEALKKELAGLSQKKESIEKAMHDSEKTLSNLRETFIGLNGQEKALKEQLKGQTPVDISELLKKKQQLTEEKTAGDKILIVVVGKIKVNSMILQKIKSSLSNSVDIQRKWMEIKILSDTANGTISGKEKVMLEIFAQMRYFDKIINRANPKLMAMSYGQYELKRKTEGAGKSTQSGLELDVVDHYNGSIRSVKSLSGGESFKASLALALALSEEIQHSAGGIKLESMFIDEGFGSLDEESLNQAIEALRGIVDGNRIVGIISHVSELKDRIDRQIIVSKSKHGGSVAKIV